jgi:SnoaL-like domain
MPLSDAVHLLAPDVICHMDRFTARGPDAWTDWVEFIRSRGVENVKVVVERFETGADGIITAYGGLTAGPEGSAVPRGGSARYRVKDGRIAEIWTSRSNYEAVFGRTVHRPLSWMLVLLRMALWRRLPRKRPVP